MNVLWNDIPGYEGIYQVSNNGEVRWKNGIRKPQISWDGYFYLKLCKSGLERKMKIHRLVAMTFIPNPDNLPEINHKNEVKTDNRVDNLEWCDRTYNNNFGTRNKRAGDGIRKAKQKRVYRYTTSGNYLDSYESAKDAEKQLNICRSNIAECAFGKRKTAGGYIWKYSGKGSAAEC